jgi:hypothetical protein
MYPTFESTLGPHSETPDQNYFIVSFIVPPYEVQGHWQN